MKWLWIVLGLVLIAGIGWYVTDILPERAVRQSQTTQSGGQRLDERTRSDRNIPAASSSWSFGDSGWQASGTPPECPDPLVLAAPVDLALADSILYPGQTRGGNYKPHGGFRFADNTNTEITVVIPLDAQLTQASRYIEQGETQYLFEFVNSCGIAYRFDHLHTLTDKFQAVADQLPAAQVDDSRTHSIEPPLAVMVGEPVATTVGFVKTGNASVDFGVYDLRTKNAASQDATWAAEHANDGQLAPHGVCWFDLLPSADHDRIDSLPAADPESGTTSDYCK